MLIKSIGWKWKLNLFHRKITYGMEDKGRADENSLSIFHNLTSYEIEDIVNEFIENDKLRKFRKNGIALNEYILSWHPKDTPKITPEIIRDMTEKFLDFRQEKGIAFGKIHYSDQHKHCHVYISANQIGSSKSTSQRKAPFEKLKYDLELYSLRRYPEIKHSFVKIKKRERERLLEREKPLTEKELQMKKRLGKKPTKKQLLKDQLQELLEKAQTITQFYELTEAQGLELYTYKNHINGFYCKEHNLKIRFSSLGFSKEKIQEILKERERRLEILNKNQAEKETQRGRYREF